MSALQRLFNRKVTAWVALLVVVIAQCPVPVVSQPAGVALGGQPFPCQGHACGCASAEQCWSSCCCFSPAERLAWVQKRGLKIPELLVAVLKRAEQSEDQHSAAKCERCIASKIEAGKHRPERSCCKENHDRSDAKSEVKFVRVIDAMKCRGLTPSVALLPPTLVDQPQAICLIGSQVIDRLVAGDLWASSICLSIDPPRPKDVLHG